MKTYFNKHSKYKNIYLLQVGLLGFSGYLFIKQ